jgi:hypothetical protein
MKLYRKLVLKFNKFNQRANKLAPASFLITSGGQTGVIWLGSMLNMHPDIMCSTGTDHPLMAMNYENNDEELLKIRAGIRSALDMRYGATPYLQDRLKLGGFFKYGDRHEIDKCRDVFFSLENVALRDPSYKANIFDELEDIPKLKNYKAFGNVRGLGVQEYLEEMKKGHAAFNGRGKSTIVVDLIRHPILRLDSVINWCHSFYELYPDYRKMIDDSLLGYKDILIELEKDSGADFSNVLDKAFFYAEHVTSHSQAWADDVKAGPNIPRILFEKLREDKEYFSRLVQTISRGKVVADDAYLDQVFSTDNLESGRMTEARFRKTRKTAREVFESWPNWHQERVRSVFAEHSIVKVYEPFGYDLSFLS